jgi:hypothetical protein
MRFLNCWHTQLSENVIYAAAKVNDIVIPRQPLFIPKVNQARFGELVFVQKQGNPLCFFPVTLGSHDGRCITWIARCEKC